MTFLLQERHKLLTVKQCVLGTQQIHVIHFTQHLKPSTI